MSLKTRLLLTTFSVALFMSILTVGVFFFLIFFHIDERVDKIYEDSTRTMSFIQKTLARNSREIILELENCPPRDTDNYLILTEKGLLLGRVRNCTFLGTDFKEAVRFTATVNGMNWFIMYSRDLLQRFAEGDPEFFDRFIDGKKAVPDYIVEGAFRLRLVQIAKHIAGYEIVDNFRTLLIDYPIVVQGAHPVGRVVFVKDFTPILEEVLLTPAIFIAYSLSLVLILSVALFLIFNKIVRDILFLRKLTAKFKESDFSQVRELSEALRKTKTRDELFYLKRSILDMAYELENYMNRLKSEKEKFEEMAYTDPLTGLSNRRFFMKEAEHFFEYARRYGEPISLIMLDIDDFKKINDTYGHDVGDLVLKRLADVIRSNTRKSDIPARFGGEEFIILLPTTNTEGALLVAERIRRDFKSSGVRLNGDVVMTTVSIGLATLTEEDSLDELIKKADEALYRAKRTGKDKVVVFTDTEGSLLQDSQVHGSQGSQ